MKVSCALIVVGIMVVGGCVPLEVAAPPVDEAMLAAGDGQGIDGATLERGRAVYIGQCRKCHRAKTISDYGQARWEKILPEMGKRAKLDAKQQAYVTGYVHRVLEVAASP